MHAVASLTRAPIALLVRSENCSSRSICLMPRMRMPQSVSSKAKTISAEPEEPEMDEEGFPSIY